MGVFVVARQTEFCLDRIRVGVIAEVPHSASSPSGNGTVSAIVRSSHQMFDPEGRVIAVSGKKDRHRTFQTIKERFARIVVGNSKVCQMGKISSCTMQEMLESARE